MPAKMFRRPPGASSGRVCSTNRAEPTATTAVSAPQPSVTSLTNAARSTSWAFTAQSAPNSLGFFYAGLDQIDADDPGAKLLCHLHVHQTNWSQTDHQFVLRPARDVSIFCPRTTQARGSIKAAAFRLVSGLTGKCCAVGCECSRHSHRQTAGTWAAGSDFLSPRRQAAHWPHLTMKSAVTVWPISRCFTLDRWPPRDRRFHDPTLEEKAPTICR